MKKTKCMGTSKNKRAMSGGGGGKGRVSRYTKKFKKCYENFSKIAESDTDDVKNDDTKIRKMEEWGRLRGIYTYLNSKKLEGNDGTFLDKMKKNIPGSTIKKYTNAMSCLENDSAILLERGCVLEKDYVNSKESAGIPIVKSKKAEEEAENIKVDEVEPAQANAEKAREETQRAEEEAKRANEERLKAEADAEKARQERLKAEAAPSNIDVQPRTDDAAANAEAMKADDEAAVEAPAPEATAVVQPGIAVDEAPVATAEVSDAEAQADASVGQPGISAVEAPAPEAMKADDETDQGGGRSKRRQKYSRRRGKSMKSKKGRKTRRR